MASIFDHCGLEVGGWYSFARNGKRMNFQPHVYLGIGPDYKSSEEKYLFGLSFQFTPRCDLSGGIPSMSYVRISPRSFTVHNGFESRPVDPLPDNVVDVIGPRFSLLRNIFLFSSSREKYQAVLEKIAAATKKV